MEKLAGFLAIMLKNVKVSVLVCLSLCLLSSKYIVILDATVVTSPINQQNRAVVLKDLIDSEKAHVAELQGLVTNFLQPLEKSCM